MILRTAAAAALFCLLAIAPARAADLSDWSTPDMRKALTELGYEVTDAGVEDGDPYLSAVADSGLKFVVYGAVCEGDGEARRCRGAKILSTFTLDSKEDVAAKVKELDYAAVSIVPDSTDDTGIMVSRYVILDHGIDPENLKTNISVFVSICEAIWDEL